MSKTLLFPHTIALQGAPTCSVGISPDGLYNRLNNAGRLILMNQNAIQFASAPFIRIEGEEEEEEEILERAGTFMLTRRDPEKVEGIDDVPALNEAQLKQTLSQNKYAMIEFGGRHCIPCRKMQPILSELAGEYGDTISIANVFVQKQMNLGRHYKIRLIPTQVIFDKGGKEIFRHTGFWEKSQILTKWRELKIL